MEKVPLFRGADIEKILQSLEELEIESGLFANTLSKKTKVFLVSMNEVLLCNYGKRLIHWRRGARIAIQRHSFQRVYTPIGATYSNASKVRVKNNVIAFYPEQHLVCKFWLDSGVRKVNNLFNEARAIIAAERCNFLKVPSIVLDKSCPRNGIPPALWLEFREGYSSSITKERKVETALEFFKVMLLWYQKHGVSFIKTEEISQIDTRANISLEDLVSYGWKREEAELILLASSKINESRKMLPVSWIHGDASVGNCLICKRSKVIILDWEMTRKGFIAIDVLKLLHQGGKTIRELYEKWLKKIVPSGVRTLPLDIQLDLVVLLENLNLQSKQNYFKNILTADEVEKRILLIKGHVLSAAKRICNCI